jgi:hypothetical protein
VGAWGSGDMAPYILNLATGWGGQLYPKGDSLLDTNSVLFIFFVKKKLFYKPSIFFFYL